MKRIAAIILLACGVAHANTEEIIHPEIIDRPTPKTQWLIEMLYDQGWFGARGVEPDGRHIGISWTREPAVLGPVLVLRRTLPAGTSQKAAAVRVVDRSSAALLPGFLYPSNPREYHPVYDAEHHPLPPRATVGEWTVIAATDGDPDQPLVDEVEPDVTYVYALLPATRGTAPNTYVSFPGDAIETWSVSAHPAWFNRRRWFHLALIGVIAASLLVYTWLAKRRELFVRRLAGVDALEDAVGRSTEMGRPVLYVTGVEEPQDVQTIASLLVLGHVAKIAAENDTDLRVVNAFPLAMAIAEQVVRQGYANAAGVNGIILRERPATNIYVGRFYAESLMLAETGVVTGAVQIAGTAELTQLPFFISACDFTLVGEELFACSAYLTREPNQLALLKAGDVMKIVIAVIVIGFTTFATLGGQGWYPFTRFSIEDVMP